MKKKFRDKLKINKSSLKEVFLWLIGGLVLLFITEFLLRGKIRYVKLLILNKPGVFLVNYLLILLITSIMFVLKRKKTFYFLISFIMVTIASISKYLCVVRGVPFTFSDLYTLQEAIGVANNYINLPIIIGILVFLLTVIAITVILFKKEKNNKRITSMANLGIIIILLIMFPLVTMHQYSIGKMGYMRWDITASYK